jgi:hypothetical protein
MPAEAHLFWFQKRYKCFPLGRFVTSILDMSSELKFQATQEMVHGETNCIARRDDAGACYDGFGGLSTARLFSLS